MFNQTQSFIGNLRFPISIFDELAIFAELFLEVEGIGTTSVEKILEKSWQFGCEGGLD